MIIGIDVGGTHTDGVLLKNNQVSKISKVKTLKDNLQKSVISVLDELLIGENKENIERIVFSTTLTTNLILQKKYPRTGLILIPGPGLNPEWLKVADHTWILSGYINHRGRKIDGLKEAELKNLTWDLLELKLKNLAIVGKFSTRNPILEEEVATRIKNTPLKIYNIQLGNRVAPFLNFPRRVHTTWLNTAVHDEYSGFLQNVKKALNERGIYANLYLLKADGGTMPLEDGLTSGVETIKSGPAASIMGALSLSNDIRDTILVVDVGGTTTDLALIVDKNPLFEPRGVEVNGYMTSVRGLLSRSLPYGGDSWVTLSEDLKPILMPVRKGPAAAFGGKNPTLTDALIITGLFKEGNYNLAYRSFADLLKDNNKPRIVSIAEEVINQFYINIGNYLQVMLEELNQHPVYTISELLTNQEIKPRIIMMIGGPAKALLPGLAKKLSLKPLLPAYHQVANALGAALARLTLRQTLYADTAQKYYILSRNGNINRIRGSFSLSDARNILLKKMKDLVLKKSDINHLNSDMIEITYEECFNIVRNFNTQGKNNKIRSSNQTWYFTSFCTRCQLIFFN